MPLPPAARLALDEADRKQLMAIRQHRSAPRGMVLRINIILGAAEGLANRVLARKLSTSVPTVLLWRKRYESDGIRGILEDRPRPGRPKRISEERESAIVEATIKTTPKDATQWSVRTMAAAQKVSPATVQRIWKRHKLQPHRVESFKFSNDPHFGPEGSGHCGALYEPARQSHRIERGREKPDSGSRPDATDPSAPSRPARAANARLPTSRDDDTIRCAECPGRNRDR